MPSSKLTDSVPLPAHPFYPTELHLAGYVANDWDAPTLIAVFVACGAVVIGVAELVVGRVNPNLKGWDRALVLWFVLTGTIHFFFEGYFAFNHARMVTMTDFFGQSWKEYGLGDSRYMTSDSFTLCMETVTAICWGPLSYLTAYFITFDSPYRHPLQALVSTGQLYGVVLYYATSTFTEWFAGVRYYRPEPYYYWTYFLFTNAFWVVIPTACILSSAVASAKAFEAVRKVGKSLSSNGVAHAPVKKNN